MSAKEVTPILRRLGQRYDGANERLDNYFESGMRGEEPDPSQFFALLQKRQVTQQAMEAELKLHEKAKKAAMNEAK
ncbi:MAG: hypothetical protein ACI9ZF_000003 [Bradyrhizobium sp.]|jgi:hypothetical protein